MKCILLALLLLGNGILSSAAQGQAASGPDAVIPFEFLHHEIVAQVQINGHGPFTVLLDTGTAPSVVDIKIARQIGLKMDSAGHQGTGGGSAPNPAYETSLPTVEIGHLTEKNVPALALDLSGLSRGLGRPIQAVLGDSVFAGRVVQFDYPGRKARFYSRSPFAGQMRRPNSARCSVFSFQHEDNVQFRDVFVNRYPVVANLDTGSNGTFSLTPHAIQKLGLERAAAHAQSKQGAGFNGGYVSRLGTVRRIQVGGVTVRHPAVVFWLPHTGQDTTVWDMNIGNVFLQNFIVTVDYQAKRVTLQRP